YQLDPTDNITFIGLPVHLIENRQALFDTIEEMIEEEGKPDLLIIDTFSNCASGIDQNAQKEVEPVLRVCHEVKDTYNIQVMLIHHTNKSDGFNGSMAFRNHVDTMIELLPDDKDEKGTIWMKCAKQRDGAESFDPIKLRLHKVE